MTYATGAGVAVLFDIPAHPPPTTGLEPLDTKDQALMVWFKVDDSFYDHPKTEDLSDSAVALWTRAGSYSAKHLTDGFISHRKAARMCDNPEAATAELLAAGLWVKDGDGYRFHDWHDYQPTREEALAASKAKSVGGAVGNHRRWHVERGLPDPNCPYCKAGSDRSSDQSSDRITDRATESVPNRPSRPDPTQSKEPPSEALFGQDKPTSPKAKASRRRATRLPDDFTVTAEMVAWAREKVPHVNGARETEKFCNYWWAKSGKDATKLDWMRTWQNWMLNAADRYPSNGGGYTGRGNHAESNAPRRYSREERCITHPNYPAHNCGPCRADRLGADREEVTA